MQAGVEYVRPLGLPCRGWHGRCEVSLQVVTGIPEAGRKVYPARFVLPRRPLLVALSLSLLLGVGLWEGMPGGHSPAHPAARSGSAPREGLSRLPLTAQGPISLALGAAQPAYRISAMPGGFRAANPAQRLHVRFDRSGVLVSAGATRLVLGLRAVGYSNSLEAVAPASPRLSANRVLYAHPGLNTQASH
jgi:hypothetical protein